MLYQDEELTGIEYPVDTRLIDILAIDRNCDFVIIELKVSRGHERATEKLLAHMGWVHKDFAGTKKVRGTGGKWVYGRFSACGIKGDRCKAF